MPDDLALSKLTDDEQSVVNALSGRIRTSDADLNRLTLYRDAEQLLKHMGLAVPPELRVFETVINVPGMAVREPVGRQDLKSFERTTKTSASQDAADVSSDTTLQEAWEYNDLGSQSVITHMDVRTYSRAFVSVGENAEDTENPLIISESPLGMGALIDPRKRQLSHVLKLYRDGTSQLGTLYTQSATLDLSRSRNGWGVVERSDHALGVVPIVMFVNQPWVRADESRRRFYPGRSEMADVIGKTDAIARMITNMQVAGETLALPHRWAAGINPKDFFDQNGKPLPVWDAYMTVLRATQNPDAKFGTFATADLDNFNKAVNNMLAWCAAELGLPTRYAGQQSVNPAAEGAIIADEIRLIKRVETMNRFDGDAWAWVMGLRERFRTGEWPARNSIRALWHNPATPTYSQRADAITKMMAGTKPILSREGAWEELGWSEARKARERRFLAEEAVTDPATQAAMAVLNGAGGAGG